MRVSNIMLTISLCAILSVSALAQQKAHAQDAGAEGQGSSAASLVKLDVTPFFGAVDTNKDNKITPEEWKATGLDEKIYSFFDKDNKGSFSKDYMSGLTHPAEMDGNKDGRLSLDELKAFVKSKS